MIVVKAWRLRWRWSVPGVLVGLMLLSGCGGVEPASVTSPQSTENLQRIAAAYSRATLALGRAPNNREELEQQLEAGMDRASLFRSTNDGEEYVIIWGVDFAGLAAAGHNPSVVFAYEKRGKDGKRLVMKGPSQVYQATDEEFRQAEFPPGYKPEF